MTNIWMKEFQNVLNYYLRIIQSASLLICHRDS